MKTFSTLPMLKAGIVFILLCSACSTAIQPTLKTSPSLLPTTTPTLIASPSLLPTTTPTILPTGSPTPEPPSSTQITIDGNTTDWAGRQILLEDPVGDSSQGFLDLTRGYAFVNQNALYLLVEVADPTAPFALFDMHFQAGNKHLQITWAPGDTTAFVTDWTSGSGEALGYTSYTTLQFNPALEARIDLRDLGSPAQVSIITVMAMADIPGRGWGDVDNWQPPLPPIVNEIDPPRAALTEIKYFYASRWGLPDDFVGEPLLTSPVANNAAIARSVEGTIYLKLWGAEAGVALLDIDTPAVTKLFNLPPSVGLSNIVGGPGETAFMNVGPEVWQIQPNGAHTTWAAFPNAFVVAYTPDGRLLGTTLDGTTLVELHQDGSMETIAEGFHGIFDVVVQSDGIAVIYEWDTGDVVRLDPDGTKRTLVPHVNPGDFGNLNLDFDGRLYMNSAGVSSFKRLDVDTGTLTDIPSAYNPCIWNPGDFVFIAPGKILLTGDQLSWADLNAGENGILIHNIASTFAADIGPDDALYIGVSGCEGQFPGRVLRVADDGSQTIYIDNLKGTIWRMAFSSEGDLYLATTYNGSNHLLIIPRGENEPIEIPGSPDGEIMSLAIDPVTGNLLLTRPRGQPILEYGRNGLVQEHRITLPGDAHEFLVAFAPDGALYGLVGRGDGPTSGPWVVRIELGEGTSNTITELPRMPVSGMSAFTVDSHGILWVILNPDSTMYQINPDGTTIPFAENLPIDAPAIVVDQAGDIYFTCASGVFRVFREP